MEWSEMEWSEMDTCPMSPPGCRFRRWICLAASILVLGLASGCITGEKSAVKIAKKINKNLQTGQAIMQNLNETVDLNDPKNTEKALRTMGKAEKLFREAVRLSPSSSKPRNAYGNVLHVMGLVMYQKYESLEADLAEVEATGRPPSRRLRKGLARYKKGYQEKLQASNKQFQFYARHLLQAFPNPMIYETLQRNHEMLEEWDQAAQAARVFMDEMKLRGPDRDRQIKIIRVYEEKAADVLEQEES
jgi:hypothetical protein